MSKYRLLWVLFATGASAYAGDVKSFKCDATGDANQVEFLAIGQPSALKIRGTLKASDALQSKFMIRGNEIRGMATVPLANLDTGIELRNRHMKEKYLEVAKHPNAQFKLTQLSMPAAFMSSGETIEVPFSGTMALHGMEKPISGTCKLEKSGMQMKMHFDFKTKISDYGIAAPGYMGIKLAEEVTVQAGASCGLLASNEATSVRDVSSAKKK